MSNTHISSTRLSLRLIALTDLEDIHALHSLPETDEFNTLGIPADLAETENIISSWIAKHSVDPITNYVFAIEESTSGNFIGLFGLNLGSPKFQIAEVWYKIHSLHWGKGYATEALKAVLEYGFEQLGLHRIEAGCAVDNIGSIKVMEKAGMTREGRKRKVLPLKSGWSDNFHYAILEEDFA